IVGKAMLDLPESLIQRLVRLLEIRRQIVGCPGGAEPGQGEGESDGQAHDSVPPSVAGRNHRRGLRTSGAKPASAGPESSSFSTRGRTGPARKTGATPLASCAFRRTGVIAAAGHLSPTRGVLSERVEPL